jgi:coenzyme PQQ precursor peptide PqqA
MVLQQHHQHSQPSHTRRYIMKWEIPQAIDFRFGMEINLYVANR